MPWVSKGQQRGQYGKGGMSERKVVGDEIREVEGGDPPLWDNMWTLTLILNPPVGDFEQESDML